VFLDVLDDVFLLHLPFEPPKGALDGLALLNLDFSHAYYTPFAGGKGNRSNMLGYHGKRGF
jgi:hypothetical protein